MEGVHAPSAWKTALDDAHGNRRVLLADRDSLTGLPAAIAAWGRDGVAVGATIRWSAEDGHDDPHRDVLLLAQEEPRACGAVKNW